MSKDFILETRELVKEFKGFVAVNGVNLGSAAHPLKHKDVIELAGVRMEFVNAPLQAAAA